MRSSGWPPKNGAQYAFYFTVIQGWNAYSNKGKSMAGIKTPNASTIVFNLTQPTGDFPYASRCRVRPDSLRGGKVLRGQPGKYGLDVISSGRT